MMKWQERTYLTIVLLFFISLAITLTINAVPLYKFDISFLNILDQVDLSEKDLLRNYRALLGYLNIPWNTTLSLPDFPVSASGALHFYEVKRLFLLNYAVLLLSFFPAIWFMYYSWKRNEWWRFTRFFQLAAIVPVVLAFFMFVGFDTFFVLFHQLFFNNDAWLFDPVTDPIITVLPEMFFMHSFVLAIILFELFVGIAYVQGKRQWRVIN